MTYKEKMEKLFKPRVKCIALYPGCAFKIGDIISNDFALQYPHLFKKLEWWQEREADEMPEYIKYYDTSLFFPVQYICKKSEAPFNAYNFTAEGFLPATEQEYLKYKKQKEQTLGGLITERMAERNITDIASIPQSILRDVKTDTFWTVSIPLIHLKNMLQLLEIEFADAKQAIQNTFKKLMKEKNDKPMPFELGTPNDLWQNEETLNKCLVRLKELMNP